MNVTELRLAPSSPPRLRSRRQGALALVALVLASLAGLGCGDGGEDGAVAPGPKPLPTFDYPLDDVLRMNHIQMKGTHNSYHIQPDIDIKEWRYTHAPLDVQLASQGVRKVELDTHYNEELGVFEVYHIGVLDEQTTCRRFSDCLASMKAWSDAFPAHHPIFVQIEPKDAFDEATAEAYFKRFEAEVLAVWPRDRIVTPDLVKGSHASIREALSAEGWPTLGEVRARVLFFMNEGGPFRDFYTRGGSDLDGRLMFVETDVGNPKPYDAIAILNDPVGDAAPIAEALAASLIVRTRADGDNEEPLVEDTSNRDAAISSGAQVVSTDYPAEVPGVDYVVEIPGGAPSRCSPTTAPSECTAEAIEDPAYFNAQ